MIRLGLESLGCPKNLIDSEELLGSFRRAGYEIVPDLSQAQVIVLNTCAFLQSAREEAWGRIEQLKKYKKDNCQVLVVAGCLVPWLNQRELKAPPEVDILARFEDYLILPELIRDKFGVSPSFSSPDFVEGRIVSTPPPYAYLRIAEGCDNCCRYCLIPSLRGPQRSLPPEKIIAEANRLVRHGAWEQVLVAQDTAVYGKDDPDLPDLAGLLEQLNEIKGLHWIRILYAHPHHLTRLVLQQINRLDKVLPYLDIPLQHAATSMLKRMGRGGSIQEAKVLIELARALVPGICLRTTMMVGFPGETAQEFQDLLDFISWAQFDHLGVFVYSPEDGTPAAHDPDQVSLEEAAERRDQVMILQQEISRQLLKDRIGQVVPAALEMVTEGNSSPQYQGRCWFQAPEIDGVTLFEAPNRQEGLSPVMAQITEAEEYDLRARIVSV